MFRHSEQHILRFLLDVRRLDVILLDVRRLDVFLLEVLRFLDVLRLEVFLRDVRRREVLLREVPRFWPGSLNIKSPKPPRLTSSAAL